MDKKRNLKKENDIKNPDISENNAGKFPVSGISFECFPDTKNKENLYKTIDELTKYKPDYISVTYGAGGKTKDRTLETVRHIKENTNLNAAAHLTCVDSKKEETLSLLNEYNKIGIDHIVALRGDTPGMEKKYVRCEGGYSGTHELVEDIKKNFKHFKISVAGYPEKHPDAASFEDDLNYLKRKCDAGADEIITQYCFDSYKILEYRDKLAKNNIDCNLKAGIMCIFDFDQLKNFSKKCGASIPQWLEEKFHNVENDVDIRASISSKIAYEQCRILSENGINNFHFYTLNRYKVVSSVCELLKKSE